MRTVDLSIVNNSMKAAIITLDAFKLNVRIEDYSTPILSASHVVENMISILLEQKGYVFQNGMCIDPQISGSPKFTPFMIFHRDAQSFGIPSEIIEFVDIIRKCRNMSAHMPATSYDDFLVFLEAFSFFTIWFATESDISVQLDTDQIQELKNYAHIIRSTFVEWKIIDTQTQKPILSRTDIDNALSTPFGVNLAMMGSILALSREVKDGFAQLEKKIDSIAEQLSAIYDKVTNFQELLEHQLDMAASEDEIDRIIKAYSDEVSNQIMQQVVSAIGDSEFDVEEKRLLDSLGQTVWDRLDPSSKEFLVTAKVSYSSYSKIRKAVDYSGVCLLVTKAIEVEMSNRFCRDYLQHLKAKYPGKANHCKFPKVMLNTYGHPIRLKDFTLGSVAYVLGTKADSSLSEAEAQAVTNEIFDFCRCKIMVGKDDTTIANALDQIADGIEQVRTDYRNPSAHTNQLQKINARQCFDLVLDVEKLLKTIIEILDY